MLPTTVHPSIHQSNTFNERHFYSQDLDEENETLSTQTQRETETGRPLTQDSVKDQKSKVSVAHTAGVGLGGEGHNISREAPFCSLCRGETLGLIGKLGRVRPWKGQDKEPKWVEDRHPPSLIDHRSMLSGSSSS